MRILGISGSLRRGSYNTRLLRAAAEELPPGVGLELLQGVAALPPYSEDADTHPGPAAVQRLRQRIASADAVLIATPEYNASVPGVLKNAVDWASRPFPDNAFRRMPTAVMGASTGIFGAVWAQAELRKVLRHVGAQVLDEELPVPSAASAFGADGGLADPELRRRLADLVEALVREVIAPLEAGYATAASNGRAVQ